MAIDVTHETALSTYRYTNEWIDPHERETEAVLTGCNRGIIPPRGCEECVSIFTCVLLRIKLMFTKRQHKGDAHEFMTRDVYTSGHVSVQAYVCAEGNEAAYLC